MKFVNRRIEKYEDWLNITYLLHGDHPKPRILLDDIEQVVYHSFGWNSHGERMYFKTDMDKFIP